MSAFGQTLNIGDTVYSPWFSRGEENGIFYANLIDKTGSPTLTISVFHKNSEDTGDGSLNASFTGMSTVGAIQSKDFTELKELVRFKYAVTGTGAGTVLFRMLTPVWYYSARV